MYLSTKDLLYPTENYIHYSVINHNGKEYEKKVVCVCVCVCMYIYVHMYICTYIYMYNQSLKFKVGINTTLWNNYMSIK